MSPPVHAYKVGDAKITRICETVLAKMTTAFLYPGKGGASAERPPMHRPTYSRDEIPEYSPLSVNVWIVEAHDRVIVIDSGVGNDKERPFNLAFHHLETPFLERLGAAGVRPENVDHVLHTHLHTDHVGWNTRLIDGRWTPTFPNAKHVFSLAERDFYATPAAESRRMVFEDSIRPIIDSGQAVVIDNRGGAYLDGVAFLPTPGHSPGHMCISIRSRGAEAIFAGDIAHTPLQVRNPDRCSAFCGDPEQARASRRWLFEYAASRQAVLFTAHFAETPAGQVSGGDDGFEWRSADELL